MSRIDAGKGHILDVRNTGSTYDVYYSGSRTFILDSNGNLLIKGDIRTNEPI